jgi:hypothetical protein
MKIQEELMSIQREEQLSNFVAIFDILEKKNWCQLSTSTDYAQPLNQLAVVAQVLTVYTTIFPSFF